MAVQLLLKSSCLEDHAVVEAEEVEAVEVQDRKGCFQSKICPEAVACCAA